MGNPNFKKLKIDISHAPPEIQRIINEIIEKDPGIQEKIARREKIHFDIRINKAQAEINSKINRLWAKRLDHRIVEAGDVLGEIPEKARPFVLSRTVFYQLLDGCTGRDEGCVCAQCCHLPTKQRIEKGFSCESMGEVFRGYGKVMPDMLYPSFTSEPLETLERRKDGGVSDYADYLRNMLAGLHSGQRVCTITRLPKGSLKQAKKTIMLLYEHWKKRVEEKNPLYHYFYVSRSTDNIVEFDILIKELDKEGVVIDFLKDCVFLSEERTQDSTLKIGKNIDHPDRKPLLQDSHTLLSADGLVLAPDGFKVVFMEAVTKKRRWGMLHRKYPLSEKSQKRFQLAENQLMLPVVTWKAEYSARENMKLFLNESELRILPNFCFDVYDLKTSTITERKYYSTLRRDLLAYVLVRNSLVSITSFLSQEKQATLSSQRRRILEELREKVDARWRQTQNLIKNNDDGDYEAMQNAMFFYYKIKNLFKKLLT